jgi:predicted nucleic acid-binding protein
MDYVYDASFTIALIAPDETDPNVEKMHRAIDEDEKIYTPQLIWYEVANVFKKMLICKRYVYEELLHFFKLLDAFNLITDFEAGINYSKKLLRLCNEYNLTSYDAAYLELAERKNAVLCTLDEGLINAAEKHGVSVIKVI